MNNNRSYTITAKPIKMLELHYPMDSVFNNTYYLIIYVYFLVSLILIQFDARSYKWLHPQLVSMNQSE